jgi:hypothetical protein
VCLTTLRRIAPQVITRRREDRARPLGTSRQTPAVLAVCRLLRHRVEPEVLERPGSPTTGLTAQIRRRVDSHGAVGERDPSVGEALLVRKLRSCALERRTVRWVCSACTRRPTRSRRDAPTSPSTETSARLAEAYAVRVGMGSDETQHPVQIEPSEITQRPPDRLGNEEIALVPVQIAQLENTADVREGLLAALMLDRPRCDRCHRFRSWAAGRAPDRDRGPGGAPGEPGGDLPGAGALTPRWGRRARPAVPGLGGVLMSARKNAARIGVR